MPGLLELSKDLAREYRITQFDSREILEFIGQDIIERLSRGEDLAIDKFGGFHVRDGKVMFKASQFMNDQVFKDKK